MVPTLALLCQALLHATVVYFERRVGHLGYMLDIVVGDLNTQTSNGPFAAVHNESVIKQLVPLDKALVAARTDAGETSAALRSVSRGGGRDRVRASWL